MSINIDKEDARKALEFDQFGRGIPMTLYPAPSSGSVTYDGEYIIWATAVPNYDAIESGHTYTRATLWVGAKIKIDTDSSSYFFFLEPYKGDYANYQGFDNRDGAQKVARSRKTGVQTATNLTDDWTVETDFQIRIDADQSDVYFYLDTVEVAHHTTNVSAGPFEICCCEPNAVARIMYLKYPPGMYFRRQ